MTPNDSDGLKKHGTLGVLSMLSASSPSAKAVLGDGFHNSMAMAGNIVLIGARTCTSNGCFSMADTNITAGCDLTNSATCQPSFGPPNGDVTAMAPIPKRNVIYVAEGGKARIYNTGKIYGAGTPADIFPVQGAIVGIKVVDP